MRIAHVGDFSVSNWGDRLYPKTLRSLLAQVGVDARTDCFAPLRGDATKGVAVGSFVDLRDTRPDFVMVGGGDLVRFDTRTVAMDHMSVASADRRRLTNRARAKLFARGHFLPGPGVWVPESSWVSGVPSMLLSMGVHTIPATLEARSAINKYDAAWVRTHTGAERLRGAGFDAGSVITAPDMIFALPELADPEPTRALGRQIFIQHGFDEPPFLFHATHFHGWDLERIVRALKSLSKLSVATLALGAYSGEDRTLTEAADRAGVNALVDLDADEITAVIAASPGLFTTSMHASIVGASFGVPVLFPGTGKTNEAFAVCPVPPRLHVVDDESLAAVALEFLGARESVDQTENRAAVYQAFERTLARAGVI